MGCYRMDFAAEEACLAVALDMAVAKDSPLASHTCLVEEKVLHIKAAWEDHLDTHQREEARLDIPQRLEDTNLEDTKLEGTDRLEAGSTSLIIKLLIL